MPEDVRGFEVPCWVGVLASLVADNDPYTEQFSYAAMELTAPLR